MKFLREISRVFRQIFYLPKNLLNFFFGTPFYDFYLSRQKKEYPGEIPLRNNIVIFLIFPEKGLKPSHLSTLNYFVNKKYSPLVISNCVLSAEDKKRIKRNSWFLIERKNYGYDFGGYRDGVLFLKDKLFKINNMILLNDSAWFPISKNSDFLNFIETANLDFIGATSHYGFERLRLPKNREGLSSKIKFNTKKRRFHYASYVLAFSKNILSDQNFFRFWKNLRLSGTKNIVVRRGEVGLTQWVINKGIYSHGSYIDSAKLEKIFNSLSKQELLKITQETIVENISLKNFIGSFSEDLEDLSKDELVSFLLIIVSRQIIVFSLANFLIKRMNFPFLKKMLFKLDKECSKKTFQIVKDLDDEVQEEILSEIKDTPALSKYLNLQ